MTHKHVELVSVVHRILGLLGAFSLLYEPLMLLEAMPETFRALELSGGPWDAMAFTSIYVGSGFIPVLCFIRKPCSS